MSLKPKTPGSIPAETDRVAKAAFPQSNTYMKMRDELGIFFFDEQFRVVNLVKQLPNNLIGNRMPKGSNPPKV